MSVHYDFLVIEQYNKIIYLFISKNIHIYFNAKCYKFKGNHKHK